MDLQSTDRGKRHNCTVFSFASDHRNSEGSVLQLKMVAATGNAPVYSALQADANLSQLSSLLKFMACGGYTGEPHATCITNPYALFYFNTLYHCQLFALRRILRALGLFWSSLVVNLLCYVFIL